MTKSKRTPILSNLSEVDRDAYNYWWDIASRGGGGQIYAMAMAHVKRLQRKAAGDE